MVPFQALYECLQNCPRWLRQRCYPANRKRTRWRRRAVTRLVPRLAVLEEQITELDPLREEMEQAESQINQLRLEASQNGVLRERFAALESEARATGKALKQSQELEAQLSSTNVEFGHKVHEWQDKFSQEQMGRQGAQALSDQLRAEVDRLKETNQQLQLRIDRIPKDVTREVWTLIEPMQKELEELRLLKVWVGHPCAGCGKPTSGVTSRKAAGEILREAHYGHGECVKKTGWW